MTKPGGFRAVANTQTPSQKQDSALGNDSISSFSALSQDPWLWYSKHALRLHLQMYMSLQCANLRLMGSYLLAFARRGKGSCELVMLNTPTSVR